MFSVGDKVKCYEGSCKSEEGIVEKVSDSGQEIYVNIYKLNPDHHSGWCEAQYWQLIKKGTTMKYFRVKKDTPIWAEGAVISNKEDSNKYKAISDLWDRMEDASSLCLLANVVEAEENAEFFERVYEANAFGKLAFVTREKARELATKFFNGGSKDDAKSGK